MPSLKKKYAHYDDTTIEGIPLSIRPGQNIFLESVTGNMEGASNSDITLYDGPDNTYPVITIFNLQIGSQQRTLPYQIQLTNGLTVEGTGGGSVYDITVTYY